MGRLSMLVVLALFLSSLQGMLGYDGIRPPTLPERDSFLKRLADTTYSDIERFTEHDVAHVMYEREPNSFQRVSKRDLKAVLRNKDESVQYNIRLEFSSGLRRMHLKLNKKQSLFDSNTRFIDHVRHGRVQRVGPPEDCYLTGNVEMEEGIPDGIASVAMCDGLHGHVSVNGSEYYIYPVEHDADEEHQAHVLSRRASEQATTGFACSVNSDEKEGESIANEEKNASFRRLKVTNTTWKTADSLVVELALFVDAAMWSILHERYPGREQEVVLITMAHVASYYSGKEKVGYWFRFKIKVYESWIEDPPGYVYSKSLSQALWNFCNYTRPRYKYDMHFSLTGKQGGTYAGYAYVGGVCGHNRCGNSQYINTEVIAHEIGHLLNFKHHGNGNCPDEVKALGGGFMYGAPRLDQFSPCNKVELQRFFSKGGGLCLFEETFPTLSDDEYANLLQVFPGQYHNPDQYCQSKLGKDFVTYRPFDFRYRAECTFRMCMNMNENSPEYLMIQLRDDLPYGAPCGRGMLCDRRTCKTWEKRGWGYGPLPREQKIAGKNTWTPWPNNWSPCSHSCGKGVQHKRRTCILADKPFFNPYCRGPSVQSRLCNLDPCPNEPVKEIKKDKKIKTLRKEVGYRVCQDMLDKKAILPDRSKYVNKSEKIWLMKPDWKYIEKESCFLQCKRENSKTAPIDKFYPDGTPCLDSRVDPEDWEKYDITTRCVQGDCIEFNDCPNNQVKDACGICGGAYLRCIKVRFDASVDVPKGERKVLAELPAGTTRIDFYMQWYYNIGIYFELWDSKEQKIIGKGDAKFVFFANTNWTFNQACCLQAEGPIDQDLVVKVYRTEKPIYRIYATYFLSDSAIAKQREKMKEYGQKEQVLTKLENLTHIFSKPHPKFLSSLPAVNKNVAREWFARLCLLGLPTIFAV